MIKRLALLLLVLYCGLTHAQTIKTDVLVIGGSPSGVAAAIQSARSKVRTILIEQDTLLCSTMVDATSIALKTDQNLPSGIWGEFRKRVIDHYKKTTGYGDTSYYAPLKLEISEGAKILAGIADTTKNLDIKLNTSFISIKKDDERWDVIVSENGNTELIKAKVVIDATSAGIIAAKAGATYSYFNSTNYRTGPNYYRTSIAMGDIYPAFNHEADVMDYGYPPSSVYCVPLRALLAKNVTNLLLTECIFPVKGDIDYLPAQLALGQGAGATAAFCAFYKTTTANLNLRLIQGELLDFKAYLLPLADISNDPYWRAIQQVCASGLLKGVSKTIKGKMEFDFVPDSVVTTAEVKPVLLETYTRAFLWFNATKLDKQFTVGNLLSFISELTLTDPDNVKKSIRRDWNTKYQFKSTFDMDRPITRREFAVLANKFLNPFSRTVDLNGRMVN